jgi:RNA polymerase sigma-70 factor (ECF subfamily)
MSSQIEAHITEALDRGDLAAAATRTLEGYGGEIFSLLAALHRGAEADADDAFSLFAENLWKGLPSFQRRSSVRTWAYAIARHASARVREKMRAAREVHVTDSAFADLAIAVRTSTWTQIRREQEGKIRDLKSQLAPDDQLLLILRVERDLDWKELARVMNEDDLDDETVNRESARLRKRFQWIKEKLRELATTSTPQ